MRKTRVSDKFQCKKDSLSELLDFLKSSFRSKDFEKAERILRSREENIKLEKEAEMKRYCTELEDKVGKLEFRNIALEDELKEYKRNCDVMKERVTRVEEDYGVISGRERRAQERIYVLCEDLEIMERERTEVKVQMKTEIRDFECGKRRAEEEIEVWKKKFGQLETRILFLEEEATSLRSIEDHFCGKLPDELSNEAQVTKERNKASTTVVEGNSRFNGAGVGQLRINENLLNTNENVHTSDVAGFNTCSPVKESRDKQIAGLPSIDMQCKSLVNVKEEIHSTPLESDMDHELRVRKQLAFELEGSSYRKPSPKLDNLKTTSRGSIDITDNEDEKDIAPKHASNLRDSGIDDNEKEQSLDNLKIAPTGMIEISDTDTDSEDEKGIAPKHASNIKDGGIVDKVKEVSSRKCLKRLYTDQSRDVNRSICEENPVTSTPKRRRAIVTSESETEDGDRIPMSKLKVKKPDNLEEIAHRPSGSPIKLHSQMLASGSEKVQESPSRKLISLRQCEEKNTMAEKNCPNDTACPNNLNMSDQKAGSAPVENYNENVVVLEEGGSDSEGESLGGFIVNGSDSSDSSTDSEDEGDTNSRFNQLIAALKRKKDEKSKWQFEADMLSSFEKDPKLCMNAVCALYRQQISEEKSAKGCLTYNGRGFNRFDALRGSNLADFLMDGRKDGDLKKSVEELEMHDSRGLEDCKRLARHYSKQLFTIYQNKEDPFFV